MDGIDVSKLMSKMIENPEMLKAAMETAQSMMGMGNFFGGTEETPAKAEIGERDDTAEDFRVNEQETEREGETHKDGNAFLPGVLPDLSKGKKDDGRVKLLMALRPYLNEKRREKIDLIVKLMGLLDLANVGGILKALK